MQNVPYVILLCLVAFAFDFLNGFHDAANSIATVVSTRVMRPVFAVVWAAACNFFAVFVFGVHVANTVGKFIHVNAASNEVILSALVGAIFWDIFTWYLGLPTSSSHALIGGLAGAAIVAAGIHSLMLDSLTKIAIFIVLAPVIGLCLGYTIRALVNRVFGHRSPQMVGHLFRRLQPISASLYSLGHGTNDAQKTMGVVTLILLNNQALHEFSVPAWVKIVAGVAISLGTMAGGWRIVKTMGMKITKLQPVDGFSAEVSAAMALFGASHAGIPVSTTHTITGAIVGVGSTRRLSAVRWGVTFSVVWAWVLTIPGAGLVAALTQLLLQTSHRLF